MAIPARVNMAAKGTGLVAANDQTPRTALNGMAGLGRPGFESLRLLCVISGGAWVENAVEGVHHKVDEQ